jgi:16S rRNA (adenine1518-N6/adenine1519-N6)-dimethyltransferase
VLEIGPGMGVLTKYLLEKDTTVFVIEIDTESVAYLEAKLPQIAR